MSKLYNFKDNFEMLYLRHDYLTKVKDIKETDIKKYKHIAATTGKLMYDKHRPNFDKVGFMADDVIAIAQVYLVSYMGLYSLSKNKTKEKNYIEYYKSTNGREPTVGELEHKEKNLLINFLRQKLYHCNVLCARKARNIIVGKDVKVAVAETKDSTPFVTNIIHDFRDFGYRKVKKKELKEAKIKAKEQGISVLTDKDGYKIIELEYQSKPLTSTEYYQLFHNKNDIYSGTPEQSLIDNEGYLQLIDIKDHFNKMPSKQKKSKLLAFIKQNQRNKHLKEELKTAKNLLRNLNKNVV